MKTFNTLHAARSTLTLLEKLPARDSGYVVLVTSAKAGEGKSFVAWQVACQLARATAGDVAFVSSIGDGDTPEPTGLLDLIVNGVLPETAIQFSPALRLSHVPGGSVSQENALFNVVGVRGAVDALQRRFAHCVIDGPVVTGCGALLLQADAVLLVVDARHTTPSAVRQALRRAGMDSSRLTGVILNHASTDAPGWMVGD